MERDKEYLHIVENSYDLDGNIRNQDSVMTPIMYDEENGGTNGTKNLSLAMEFEPG